MIRMRPGCSTTKTRLRSRGGEVAKSGWSNDPPFTRRTPRDAAAGGDVEDVWPAGGGVSVLAPAVESSWFPQARTKATTAASAARAARGGGIRARGGGAGG